MRLVFSPLLPLALPLAPYPVPWIEPTDRSELDRQPDKRADERQIERCRKPLN
jgi:hypothetical protein